MNPTVPDNIDCTDGELNWLRQRIDNLFNKKTTYFLPLPPLKENTFYKKVISDFRLNDTDRVMLNMALASTCRPEALEGFLDAYQNENKRLLYTTFARGPREITREIRPFQPTVRTALFLLAGDDMVKENPEYRYGKEDNQ